MGSFEAAIADFGHSLGLDGLSSSGEGLVELSIERVGRLQLEEAGVIALITLARPWPPHAARAAIAALELCHWRENRPWPVHAGAKGGEWLTFTARLPLEEVDVPTLNRVVEQLSGMFDAVEKAG